MASPVPVPSRINTNASISTNQYGNEHEDIRENDEYTPLLRNEVSKSDTHVVSAGDVEAGACSSPLGDKPRAEASRNIIGVISILLLGVFVANADSSLVLATSGTISSEFHDLGDAGWLISSYTLAMCAAQSLVGHNASNLDAEEPMLTRYDYQYGQLSDIYGRKNTILMSYMFFTVGSAICGAGQSLPQVVFGRLVAGVGGAGINCLVSIVIADMVPIREVASWRSYVNIAATTGRSLGGPIGGYLIDTIGWRWSFLGQCPPTIVAGLLVAWKLKPTYVEEGPIQSQLSKLRRIDFLGAILLSASIVCGLLVLELGGKRIPFTHPTILFLLGASLVAGNLFLLVEGFWAKEPIFPLRLMLNRDVVASYINLGFQTGAQMAMMMLVPMYFQISAHASMTNAGAHLMPSVIGNAFGGLLSGYIIRRTGRYKVISLIGAFSSSTAYLLMILRWHGHTSFLESLYIIPGGFGNGIALSTSFISLTAGVEPCQVAIASSGLYLSSNVGMVLGLSLSSAILQSTLRKELRIALEGTNHRETIIRKSLSDIEYVRSLEGRIGRLVTEAYVRCLTYTHGVSLAGAIVALLAAMAVKEHLL